MSLPDFLEISQTILQENALSVQFPGGTTFSFPALVQRDGRLLDAMFLYPGQEDKKRETGRPYAWMMLESTSGKVALLSDCKVLDFVNTEEYPFENPISLKLPKQLNPKEYTKSYKDLYEIYEQIRLFAFEPDPDNWQLEIMDLYRELFIQLVPMGHYPFYASLAPAYFQWLHLKLMPEASKEFKAVLDPMEGDLQPPECMQDPEPMEDADEILPEELSAEEPLPDMEASVWEKQMMQELSALREEFFRKREADSAKDKMIDQLHAELSSYKNGLLDALTAPLENDLIKVIDDVEKSVEAYRRKYSTKENFRKLQQLLEGVEIDLCDVLYRHGMEPFHVDGEDVDVHRQKILTVIPTPKTELDKKVAVRHSRGWEKDGKVMRQERISVYVFQAEMKEEPSQLQ